MGNAEQYGGLLGHWEAQRSTDLVEADPKLADLISSGTLDSPWANLETGVITLDILPETEGIVSKLNSDQPRLEKADG